ncbi:LysR family transcriptional regulator [Burkholderia sp. R-69927]|uniref:LysR family transcriptional regulator n=1 Tax=Paraburkholderia domus TaxID=2793075 RepID=UPI00191480AC|nr:LysR family transcriptional regulator [Paraburkholderia domus]MBK5086181.1 LysR family transcriptional regulator [Burkholderia sp. R-69927]
MREPDLERAFGLSSTPARHATVGRATLEFSRAAQELCVTQSAVSHQIQQLENWAGQQLFRRVGRGGGCRLMRGNCSAKP